MAHCELFLTAPSRNIRTYLLTYLLIYLHFSFYMNIVRGLLEKGKT